MTDAFQAFNKIISDVAMDAARAQMRLEAEYGIRLELDDVAWSEDHTKITFNFKPYDYTKHRGSEDFDD